MSYDIRDEMIEAVECGNIDAEKLAKYLICWMREQEAKDFLQRNDLESLAPYNLDAENLIDEP